MPPDVFTPEQMVEWAKAEAEYINNEKDQYLDSATHAGDQANISSRTLSGQLLLISGAILTFSSAIVGGSSIGKLSYSWKATLIFAWIILVMSAATGVGQIYSERKFFILWHNYNAAIAKELVTGKYNSSNVKSAVTKFKKPQVISSSLLLDVQSGLLATGIVIFVIVIAHLLFVPPVQTPSSPTVLYGGTHNRYHGLVQ